MDRKKEIRAKFLKMRQALPKEEVREKSLRIMRRIEETETFKNADNLLAYIDFRGAEFEVQFTQMYDLSLNEGMLLCTLLNTPKLTSSKIAEALGLSASNTSKVIRSVEEKKLITRLIGKEDKRQMRFFLTTEGKNRISDIKNATFELPGLLQQVVSLV